MEETDDLAREAMEAIEHRVVVTEATEHRVAVTEAIEHPVVATEAKEDPALAATVTEDRVVVDTAGAEGRVHQADTVIEDLARVVMEVTEGRAVVAMEAVEDRAVVAIEAAEDRVRVVVMDRAVVATEVAEDRVRVVDTEDDLRIDRDTAPTAEVVEDMAEPTRGLLDDSMTARFGMADINL